MTTRQGLDGLKYQMNSNESKRILYDELVKEATLFRREILFNSGMDDNGG
jgi:hypothetical protein